jgi:hypothetical protein
MSSLAFTLATQPVIAFPKKFHDTKVDDPRAHEAFLKEPGACEERHAEADDIGRWTAALVGQDSVAWLEAHPERVV